MYHEPMFLRSPEFEKVATTIKLPDDEKKWAPKILSELHRQVPVMDQFHANIILDRLEPNKGFGFGYIIAQPKVLNPLMSAGLPKIKIPVVVKNWHLSPLDVFYDPEGKGFAQAKAYAAATGGDRAGVLESSFVAEGMDWMTLMLSSAAV